MPAPSIYTHDEILAHEDAEQRDSTLIQELCNGRAQRLADMLRRQPGEWCYTPGTHHVRSADGITVAFGHGVTRISYGYRSPRVQAVDLTPDTPLDEVRVIAVALDNYLRNRTD